jgi:hypothetical protein
VPIAAQQKLLDLAPAAAVVHAVVLVVLVALAAAAVLAEAAAPAAAAVHAVVIAAAAAAAAVVVVAGLALDLLPIWLHVAAAAGGDGAVAKLRTNTATTAAAAPRLQERPLGAVVLVLAVLLEPMWPVPSGTALTVEPSQKDLHLLTLRKW